MIGDKISKEDAVRMLSSDYGLVTQVIEKDIPLSISDGYWMIAHLTEESVTNAEIRYFIDCYQDIRKYDLQEKMEAIKNGCESNAY